MCPPAVRVAPARACSRHPRRGHDQKFEEPFVATACVVCMRCMHSVFSTHTQQAAHPVLEQPRIEGACRGRDRRWNSGAQFTLPLRGHSPGPSGLGGVYLSKLLRVNIFQSTAGQGSVRSIAGSSWARRLPRGDRHRSRAFAHRVPHLAKRGVRGPERGPRTVAQEGAITPRCTSSSGLWCRWLNKSPNGVAAMPSRVLRSVMRSVTTRTSRG